MEDNVGYDAAAAAAADDDDDNEDNEDDIYPIVSINHLRTIHFSLYITIIIVSYQIVLLYPTLDSNRNLLQL